MCVELHLSYTRINIVYPALPEGCDSWEKGEWRYRPDSRGEGKAVSDHAETLHSFLAKDAGERLPVICLQKGPQEVFNEKINGSQERAFLSLYSFKPHAFKALTHDYQFVWRGEETDHFPFSFPSRSIPKKMKLNLEGLPFFGYFTALDRSVTKLRWCYCLKVTGNFSLPKSDHQSHGTCPKVFEVQGNINI